MGSGDHSMMMIFGRLMDIAVGNLEAYEVGGDETEESYREIDECGEVLAPELRVEEPRATIREPKA